jgi:hypothetical protein
MKALYLGVLSSVLFLSAVSASTAQQAGSSAPNAPDAQAASSNLPDVIGSWPNSQAYPAKFSQQNDRLDKLPVMAHQIPLTDAQKRRIVETVKQQNAPVETVAAAPSQMLPYNISLQPLPNSLATEIPILDHLSYIRVPNKILLVMPANKIVVGELATE